jgi:hypothetical protein
VSPVEKLLPVIRDVVFLTAGTFVFVRESLGQARWMPMLLGIVAAAGPAVVSAYWSGARTPDSPPSGSSPQSSSSPSSSSPPS